MNQTQFRELQPFQWEIHLPPTNVQEVSTYDWDIEEEGTFEPLTLQDLQSEDDNDSLPSLVSTSSCEDNTNTTLTNIMMYTIDKEVEDNDGECECPICYEPIHKEQKIKTNCNHIYCDTCMMTYLDTCYINRKDPCCALCREEYTLFEIPNPPTFEKVKEKFQEYEPDTESDTESDTGIDETHFEPNNEAQFNYLRARRSWNFRSSIPISFDIETIFAN